MTTKEGFIQIIFIVVAAGLLVVSFVIVLGLFSQIENREPVGAVNKSGAKVFCASWSNAPAGYQDKITASANKVGVHPALLGAMFLNEHNNNWATPENADGSWARGGAAIGPFQIEVFENKWKTVSENGFTPKVYCADPKSPPAGKACADPESMEDSSLAAAGYIHNTIKALNFSLTTTDKNEIRCIGTAYNGGDNMCREWKNKGYPETDQPNTTHEYHNRTWDNFEKLVGKCETETNTATKAVTGKACGVTDLSTDYATANHRGVDMRLLPPAAKNFDQLAAEFYRQTGKKVILNSVFRSRVMQQCICKHPDGNAQLDCYTQATGPAEGSWLAGDVCINGLAARPGSSPHESGRAFDINIKSYGKAEWTTLVNISGTYNYKVLVNEYGAKESWHFTYTGLNMNQADAIKAANTPCP